MTQRTMATGLAVTMTLMLAACGSSPMDRALSGAALGAGAGAVGAAILDENVGAGALIGGGLGAGAGYLTDPSMFNLGDPYWAY